MFLIGDINLNNFYFFKKKHKKYSLFDKWIFFLFEEK